MKKKRLLLSLLSLVCSFTSRAQFYMGGGAALNAYGKGVGLYPALQPRLGFDYKQGKVSLSAGFNFSPLSQNNKFNVSYHNDTRTSSTSVAYTEHVSINNYFFHFAYRPGNMENAFRFKIIGGASNDLIRVKYSSNSSIPAGYRSDDVPENGNTAGPKVDFGIGADYRTGERGDLYCELIMAIPANK